jgi:DNA replication protein DnaC
MEPIRRSWEEERAEVSAYLRDAKAEVEAPKYQEGVGRIPVGPSQGWRTRERKAKTCDLCEGDLWIETDEGVVEPCRCRQRRREGRARNRLRAGNWWRGTSLSFAAPPLAQVDVDVSEAIHRLVDDVVRGAAAESLWLFGGEGEGKSALCAYLGQRLFPGNFAAVQHLGDLLAHLRWLGAVKGEAAVTAKLDSLVRIPLLVVDDIDRPIRTFQGVSDLGLKESCSSRDLLRLVTLLTDRLDSNRPLLVTSRVRPSESPERTSAVSRPDLVRGLITTMAASADPFEDFPSYTTGLLNGALSRLQNTCRSLSLSARARARQAA